MSDQISKNQIGLRVKVAREAVKMKQEDFAVKMGIKDRQTISDIENGKRALKPEELVQISEIFDRELEFFLEPFSVIGEAKFSWRAAADVPEKDLDNFEAKAGRWVGLLRWLSERQSIKPSVLKHTLRLSAQSSYEDAQRQAELLGKELHLAQIPATNLLDKIENELNIPVLFIDTVDISHGDSVSGATCHLNEMGVIIINRNEPETRRNFDLAHELFHVLTWDVMEPEHRDSNSVKDRKGSKRIEQLADNFASTLLMPQYKMLEKVDSARVKDIQYLCDIADYFKVSPQVLAWRMYVLKMIDEETREQLLKKQSIKSTETPKLFSINFVQMLQKALDQGHLSVRKVSKTLGLDIEALENLFKEYQLPVPFNL